MTNSIRVMNPFKNIEEKFITAIEQYWNEHGHIPTGDKLIELRIVKTNEEYLELINSDFIQRALNSLGIKIDTDLQTLTPKQLAAAQVMFDFHDGRSDIKKLRDLKISGQTWDNWLKDPVFQDYLRTKVKNLYGENEHEIDRALFLKARTGNVEAIRLINAMTGRYQEIEAPKIGPVEAHVFMMRLFEVLQIHLINEPEKLKAIGQAILDIRSPYMEHPKVIEAIPIENTQ